MSDFTIRRGFTLIELTLTAGMLVVLIAVSAYIFKVALLTWSSQETRGGIKINMDRGIEQMARDLRKAQAIQSSNDEIRFTQGANSFIYYLYNASDTPYPPAFSQSSYQLMRQGLTGGIGGTFTYGSGTIIINDVVPPPTSDMSASGNVVTIDLSGKWRDETIRARTEVRPRNL